MCVCDSIGPNVFVKEESRAREEYIRSTRSRPFYIFCLTFFFDAEMIGTKKQTGKSALLIKEACLK